MSKTIEVLAIDSEVVIDGEIPARITRICIEDEAGCVCYECVWWDERVRKLEWLRADEIKPKDPKRTSRISVK